MARTLLLIFAHPDDETFLAGGLSCRASSDGTRVVLATATRGERGKAGEPPLCAPAELPAVREAELRRAAAILGIAELHLLGYRDRDLAAAPRARDAAPERGAELRVAAGSRSPARLRGIPASLRPAAGPATARRPVRRRVMADAGVP